MGQGTINKLYFRTVPTIRQYREDKWGKKMIEVRMLDEKETEEAFSLIWEVFLEFVAPDYTQ